MVKKQNRIALIMALILILFLSFFITRNELKMKDYGITCAKFVRAYRVKSNWYYEIEFNVGNKYIKTSRPARNYTSKRAKYIKRVKCIEIAYSKSDPTHTSILDKELRLFEWLWFLNEKDKKKYCW